MPRIEIYDSHGVQLQTLLVEVPSGSDRLVVVTDVLSGANREPCCAANVPFPEKSAFSIKVSKLTIGLPTSPAYVGFASVVDNETNDSTIFVPFQVGFPN
jgi:hypothetical protein